MTRIEMSPETAAGFERIERARAEPVRIAVFYLLLPAAFMVLGLAIAGIVIFRTYAAFAISLAAIAAVVAPIGFAVRKVLATTHGKGSLDIFSR